MNLLFDQNISSRIVRLLDDSFKGCTHVKLEGLTNAKDMEIWNWAKRNNCCIVSFDSDFLDVATLNGFPPKVLLLRTGNRKTSELATLLQQKSDIIKSFLQDSTIGCLEIH